MSNQEDIVIGIDLGTTMSAVSIMDDIDNLITIPNQQGQKLTPSAVLILEDEIIVGQNAIYRASESPKSFAECFKRSIGRPYYEPDINGFKVPPEILCAFLIEQLKQDAERFTGKTINNAVITVPAFYGSRRRQATRLAGELAGLNVLDIVNEPTAAAMAYGFQHKLFQEEIASGSNRTLVFDLGGGTFDVSLLEFQKNRFATLATDGNVRLGGRDFDTALRDHVAEQFFDSYGVDPRSSPSHNLQLFQSCRVAKHTLSHQAETTISFEYEQMRLTVPISRSTFEELIESHVDLTYHTCDSVLKSQKMRWSDLDYILFVGGSCRIPFVAERIESRTGKKPIIAESPDEIVAQGAAVFAASKSMDDESHIGFEIVNVNSHSLGIAGVDTETKEKVNKILIPRNTPLPAVKKKKFPIHRDGQKGVSVTLLEGESQNPAHCEEVAKSAIILAPNTPAGTQVEVICQYRVDGTIHVSARVMKDRKATSLEVRRQINQNYDSLRVWQARLLNKETDQFCSSSEIPDLPAINLNEIQHGDRSEIRKGLEYQYQEIGKVAYASTLIPDLISQRRAVQKSIEELLFFNRVVELIERKLARESDFMKKSELEGKLHRAKNELVNLQSYAQHCRIVLGRECVDREFYPPGVTDYVNRVKNLKLITGN